MTAKRVLVVEDRPEILELMLLGLEGAGFEVDAALNGREALELQQRRAADVVITDIFMPEMDGIETIDRIRAEYPATRIIAMACDGERKQDYLKVARQIGADATLAKPFATADLLQLVRMLMRQGPGAS
jgi:CheY-like chemotaxis protein